MRKVVVFCLAAGLTLLIMVCADGRNATGAQEQTPPTGYGFESDSMSMEAIGELLEQFVSEMRQNGSVTYRGNTYPFSGYGGLDFGIRIRPDREGNLRTGFEIGFQASGPGDRVLQQGGTYYQTSINGPPDQVADYIDQMVANLASSGTFEMDIHTAEFVGSAIIDQRLIENVRRQGRGLPYALETFVTFGEGEVERHDDDERFVEGLENGNILALGVTETVGADQAAVAEVFSSLASSLRSQTIRVADGEAEWGEDVRFSVAHLAGGEEGSQKIELYVRFGPAPEPLTRAEREEGPRYYVEEAAGMSMTEFAALLQRIAAEILEDGTFMLEGEEVVVGDSLLGGEIGINPRGLGIEVNWRR